MCRISLKWRFSLLSLKPSLSNASSRRLPRRSQTDLQTSENVVQSGQVDERVHGGSNHTLVRLVMGIGIPTRSEDGTPVQLDAERNVAVIHRMGHTKRVSCTHPSGGKVDGGNELLHPVGVVLVPLLAREVPRLTVRVLVQVSKKRVSIIDPAVGHVVQGRGQTPLGRQGSGIHHNLGILSSVDSREKL